MYTSEIRRAQRHETTPEEEVNKENRKRKRETESAQAADGERRENSQSWKEEIGESSHNGRRQIEARA